MNVFGLSERLISDSSESVKCMIGIRNPRIGDHIGKCWDKGMGEALA